MATQSTATGNTSKTTAKKGEPAESSKAAVIARQAEKAVKGVEKKVDHEARKAAYDNSQFQKVKQKMARVLKRDKNGTSGAKGSKVSKREHDKAIHNDDFEE